MYKFTDTAAATLADGGLPAEALSFGGVYLENEIPGYRTLSVSGREAVPIEITTRESSIADGARYVHRRYKPREITVNYQLVSESSGAFRDAYNQLNYLLSKEQQQCIFNDERDKFYTGTMSEIKTVDAGRNAVTGSFVITCEDPFKYSVEEYEADFDTDGGLTVSYDGTSPAYPRIVVTTKSDVGFISVADADGHMMFFGDENQVYESGASKGNVMEADWTKGVTLPTGWIKNKAIVTKPTTYLQDKGLACTAYLRTNGPYKWRENSVRSTAVKSTSDSIDHYHGTGMYFELSDPMKSCNLGWRTVFYTNNTTGINTSGQQEVALIARTDAGAQYMVAWMHFDKVPSVNQAIITYGIGGTVTTLGYWVIDPQFGNKYTSGFYWEGSRIRSTGHCRISKQNDGTIRWQLMDKVFEAKVDSLKDVKICGVSVYMGGYTHSFDYMDENGLVNLFLADTTNSFSGIGDIEIQPASGKVYFNGAPIYGVSAMGNDYEGFQLQPGTNSFKVGYSSWSEVSGAKLYYRKAYI